MGNIDYNSYSQKCDCSWLQWEILTLIATARRVTLPVIATAKCTALIVMSTANLKGVTVTVAD